MEIGRIPQEVLEAVRQRLGGKDENDDKFDADIEDMSIENLLLEYARWEQGDGSIVEDSIKFFKEMKMEHNKLVRATCGNCGNVERDSSDSRNTCKVCGDMKWRDKTFIQID